uniref:Uncharacterized protein n=1 Tax=Tetranychus urticae TaxID=32264 RepID=T1K1U3_TETUR
MDSFRWFFTWDSKKGLTKACHPYHLLHYSLDKWLFYSIGAIMFIVHLDYLYPVNY